MEYWFASTVEGLKYKTHLVTIVYDSGKAVAMTEKEPYVCTQQDTAAEALKVMKAALDYWDKGNRFTNLEEK